MQLQSALLLLENDPFIAKIKLNFPFRTQNSFWLFRYSCGSGWTSLILTLLVHDQTIINIEYFREKYIINDTIIKTTLR